MDVGGLAGDSLGAGWMDVAASGRQLVPAKAMLTITAIRWAGGWVEE
jgi:hypothetical protein